MGGGGEGREFIVRGAQLYKFITSSVPPSNIH